MNKYYAIFALTLVSSLSSFASPVGRVYLDKNSNGKFDQGEALANVKVSNGREVVRTNKSGGFKLPDFKKGRFVFITVPTGLDAKGTFFYPLSESDTYEFSLTWDKYGPKGKRPKTARFIQITDTETFVENAWIGNIKDYARKNKLDFIVHTGDICYAKGLKFHAEKVNSKTMELPMHYCIGNHDLVNGKYGEELFQTLFGPVYYSFDVADTHFVVTPMLGGDRRPSYTKAEVCEWLINDLATVDPKKKLVVFNHDLLTFGNNFTYTAGGKSIDLVKHNLQMWIYGHWHINFMKQHGKNGPLSISSSTPDKGGIDHSPSNFIVYDSYNPNGAIEARYTYLNQHLTINSPRKEVLTSKGYYDLNVNTYNTVSPTVKVEYTLVNNGKRVTKKLKRQSIWNYSQKIKVPASGLNGTQKVEVKATYRDGTTASETVAFKFVKKNTTPLALNWVKNCNSNIWMTAPVVKNNRVFTATIDDFQLKSCYVVALNATTGKPLWRFKTKGSVKNDIVYSKGKVLATDHFGIAYVLDEKTGKLIWEKDLGMNRLGAYIGGNVVENGIYYTGFGNFLQAIEIGTGKVLWKNNSWSGGEGSTATMVIADNLLIASSNWRSLYAHDKTTGKLVWRLSKDGYRFRNSTANYKNGVLYVCSKKGVGSLSLKDGSYKQYFTTNYDIDVSSKPLITDKLVIMGSERDGLIAYNRKDGQEVWKVKTKESLVYSAAYSGPSSSTVESSPKLVNGKVVFAASDGILYVVNQETGAVEQTADLGSPVLSPITSIKNNFWVNDFAGNVYKFTLK